MGRTNSVIVYLVKASSPRLVESLKALHQFFNAQFSYPILIFHEELTASDQKELSSLVSSQLSFIQLPSFNLLSPEFDAAQIQRWCEGEDEGRKSPLGYRQMCRFYSYTLFTHPAMEGYEYYWRFDDDSFLCGPINYDPFEYMEKHNQIYGYRTIEFENPRKIIGIPQLWEATKSFAKAHKLSTRRLKKLCANWKGRYTGFNYYNNFEINKLSFWKNHPLYKKFFDYLDRDHLGFYKYRWGDSNVRAMGIGLFVDPKQVHLFKDITYRHNDHYARPDGDRNVYSKRNLFLEGFPSPS